jgi:hypothetical protein
VLLLVPALIITTDLTIFSGRRWVVVITTTVLEIVGIPAIGGEHHKEQNISDSTSGVLEDLVLVFVAALLECLVEQVLGLIKNSAAESTVT